MANDNEPEEMDHANVIAPPPLIYLSFLIIAYPLGRIWPWTILEAYWPALVLAVGGVLIALAAIREFHRAKTHVLPHKPTTAIITTGPFAYSRNPLYLVLAFSTAPLPWSGAMSGRC